jgi:hypothetical protein
MNEQEHQQLHQNDKERLLRTALKIPAGRLNVKSIIATQLLKEHHKHDPINNKPLDLSLKKEVVKKSEQELNNLSPVDLCGTLDSMYPDWSDWLPETLWSTIKCDENTRNKIRAIQTVLHTPDIQFDVNGFCQVVNAFNNNPIDWLTLEPIPCEEIVYAYLQIKLIQKQFDPWDEVISFIKACMREDGIIYLPWLEIESCNGVDLPIDKVKIVWSKIKDSDFTFTLDDVINIQLGRLKEIQEYIKGS